MRKRPKYKNQKTTVDGIKFDSIAESRHYNKLKFLESQGLITRLARQVKFDFQVNGETLRYADSNRVMQYVADFEYYQNGERKIVDVKGFKTRDYLIKKALMKRCHGILIEEVA